MIYGIGVDILSVARLEDLRGNYSDPFFKKTYTDAEFLEALNRSNPIKYFAERFAAKEAVFKALQIASDAFRFNQIETLNDKSGCPHINLYGHVKEVKEKMGITNLYISLSNDGDFVVAFAVCET